MNENDNVFKSSEYCFDPLIYIFLDKWKFHPITIPLTLATLVTLLEFAWAIPNNFMVSKIVDGQKIVGILDDPAFYYSNWLAAGAIWLYFAWMPKGIYQMFAKLKNNGVIKLEDSAEKNRWGGFQKNIKNFLGSKWLTTIPFLIIIFVVFFIYFPSVKGWAGQSLYGRILVSCWMVLSLYSIVQIVLRQVIATFLLSKMFSMFKFNILPLHPDRAGGLAPLGSFALKSTYLITIIGFIIVFTFFNKSYQNGGVFGEINYSSELLTALIAYLLLAPITFFAPLSTAHNAMYEAKDEMLLKLSHTFEKVYKKMYQSIIDLSKNDDVDLNRLNKIEEFHKLTENFPVWPFNTTTLRQFFASTISPILLAILPKIVDVLFSLLIKPRP